MRLRPSSVGYSVGLAAALALVGSGCARKGDGGAAAKKPTTATEAPATGTNGGGLTTETPVNQGQVVIAAGSLPTPTDTADGPRIKLPAGDFVNVSTIRGEQYITVQAVLEETGFKRLLATARSVSRTDAELATELAAPLASTIEALSKQVGGLEAIRSYPKYGFFLAKMKLSSYSQLANVRGLPTSVVLAPVVVNPIDERSVRKMDSSLVDQLLADGRGNLDGFSGLTRMEVPQFLEAVKADLGTAVPDGSRVKVGVTDTGITYNHPSFTDKDGNTRIAYMKDFTAEGRIYFNPAAKFEVTVPAADAGFPADVLLIDAEVLPPVKGAAAVPVADNLRAIATPIRASDELKALLTTAGNGAKLGILSETSFSADPEFVDLNQNGKVDDSLLAIIAPAGEGAYKLYFAAQGGVDFRGVSAIGDFNTTHGLIKLSAEQFGFHIQGQKLANAAGEEIDVVSASIVGFDPGNHGSHVAGIVGGRKTIANDSDDTLARGVAPNAQLMMNRVCANNGGCEYSEAIIDMSEAGAEIVNMSLGGLSPYNDGYGVDEIVIDRLTEMNNTLFVISAGNSGPGLNTIGSPGNARHALSVGATASRTMLERQYQWPGTGKLSSEHASKNDDFMLFFSSRGPNAAGGFKPNITAPGTELSAVQLNTAPGTRAGLEVYWGTSMAAPSAAGAIALLLDAAKLYNTQNPDKALPLDALTLRKVIIASAKPFDVTKFDLDTGDFQRGQYTWVDQGTGMVNLPRAWAALKAERDTKLPSAVYALENGVKKDIALDYQVRVLRTGPNNIKYDGSLELPPEIYEVTGPRFGRGIWLDAKQTESLIPVQIARRLPYSAAARGDLGDLQRLLKDTKDEFVVKTSVYGSKVRWVGAGSMNQLDCAKAPKADLIVIGEGATDAFDAPGAGRSIPHRESTLYVCVNRELMATLPAGDHGALISLHRKSGDKVEANAALIVPVYVTVPNKTLVGSAGFSTDGGVEAFGLARHYVDVPAGVSLVTVTLEVPAADVNGSAITGCQGVRLYAYEAGNTLTPAEIAGSASIAKNCDDFGNASPETRKVTYARANPNPGIWNLHVFGRYQFAHSAYKISVEYAKVQASVAAITGGPEALDGAIDFKVLEASFAATPSATKTTLTLDSLLQELVGKLEQDEQQLVPDADGKVARTYGDDVATVAISTGGSTGNDIDLAVLECADEALTDCGLAGQSAGATDVEKVEFQPVAGKFYAALAVGYAMPTGTAFVLGDKRTLKTAEKGAITVEDLGGQAYKIGFAFDQEASKILQHELFLSGKFSATGDLVIRTETNSVMASVPVKVAKPVAPAPAH